jgi:hypothetical protein
MFAAGLFIFFSGIINAIRLMYRYRDEEGALPSIEEFIVQAPMEEIFLMRKYVWDYYIGLCLMTMAKLFG